MISVVCVVSETGADSGGSSQEAGNEKRPCLFQEMLHSSLQPQQELSQGLITLQHYPSVHCCISASTLLLSISVLSVSEVSP